MNTARFLNFLRAQKGRISFEHCVDNGEDVEMVGNEKSSRLRDSEACWGDLNFSLRIKG